MIRELVIKVRSVFSQDGRDPEEAIGNVTEKTGELTDATEKTTLSVGKLRGEMRGGMELIRGFENIGQGGMRSLMGLWELARGVTHFFGGMATTISAAGVAAFVGWKTGTAVFNVLWEKIVTVNDKTSALGGTAALTKEEIEKMGKVELSELKNQIESIEKALQSTIASIGKAEQRTGAMEGAEAKVRQAKIAAMPEGPQKTAAEAAEKNREAADKRRREEKAADEEIRVTQEAADVAIEKKKEVRAETAQAAAWGDRAVAHGDTAELTRALRHQYEQKKKKEDELVPSLDKIIDERENIPELQERKTIAGLDQDATSIDTASMREKAIRQSQKKALEDKIDATESQADPLRAQQKKIKDDEQHLREQERKEKEQFDENAQRIHMPAGARSQGDKQIQEKFQHLIEADEDRNRAIMRQLDQLIEQVKLQKEQLKRFP